MNPTTRQIFSIVIARPQRGRRNPENLPVSGLLRQDCVLPRSDGSWLFSLIIKTCRVLSL
jgi:hypothetical protein